MGLFDAAFNFPDGPISLENVARWMGGGPTRSGISVGPDTALRQATVYACVRVVSEDVAKVPLIPYRRTADDGRERLRDHALPRVLKRPNKWQTGFQFREQAHAAIELRGAAVARIVRYPFREDRTGELRELLPLHPDKVSVHLTSDWTLEFKVNGKTEDPRDILYLPGLTLDGYTGVTPITYLRETIGVALAAERHGALLFGNGARPGMVAEAPAEFSPEAAARLKASIEEQVTGDNAFRLLMLEEGAKLSTAPVAMTNKDSQFLEMSQLKREEICGAFRVPPHKVMKLDRATFSNIEHQSIEYVVDALMGRAVRMEEQINAQLLTERERDTIYVEHLFEGLLRGDSKSRAEYYDSAINKGGWMNPAEARRLENLPKGPPELNEFRRPLNMQTTGDPPPDGGDE